MNSSVSITLPAICNGTTEKFPHMTLLYAGEVEDQDFPLDFIMNAHRRRVSEIAFENPLATYVKELALFGEHSDTLVARLEIPKWLFSYRESWLSSGLLDHKSQFDFDPHITLGVGLDESAAIKPGDTAYLFPPVLWWGDYKFKL